MVDVKRNLNVDAFAELEARSTRLRVPWILGSNEARDKLKSSLQALWMMILTDERS